MRTSRSLSSLRFLSSLLCGLGFCALPCFAQAQATKVPVLGDLPLLGKLFVNHSVAPVNTPESSLLVTVEGKSVTLGQLIDLLMEQAHVSYTLDARMAALPTGNVKLRKVPFAVALAVILKMAHGRASYTLENGIYRIMPIEEAEAEKQAENAPNAANVRQENRTSVPEKKTVLKVNLTDPETADTVPVEDRHITLDAVNARMYTVLNLIFGQTGGTFTLGNGVQDYPISLHMENVPLHIALGLLLKSSGKPLMYKVEKGIYKIIMKEEVIPESLKR